MKRTLEMDIAGTALSDIKPIIKAAIRKPTIVNFEISNSQSQIQMTTKSAIVEPTRKKNKK